MLQVFTGQAADIMFHISEDYVIVDRIIPSKMMT